MAGTRIILANYLGTLGLGPAEIQTVISVLIEQPEYPNLTVLHSCFGDLGLKLSVIDANVEDLAAWDTPVISSVNLRENYIILLGVKNFQVYYLDAGGKLTAEFPEQFTAVWDNKIYLITPSVSLDNLKSVLQHKLSAQTFIPNYRPSLRQIRKAGLQNEPFIYRFCRLFSVYLTYSFTRFRIHPNVITTSWLVPIICAGVCFSGGFSLLNRWTAIVFILLGLTLDCCDGEVARLTGKSSSLGGHLDSLIHFVSSPILIIGIICGVFHTRFSIVGAIWGLVFVATGIIYNYLVHQLNVWRRQANPYAQFHPLFSLLFYLYPLDIVIFMVGGILNKVPEAMWLWFYLSVTLMVLLLTSFILQEMKQARKS
jgi:phosphatidylglycerophosphate synthase